MENNLVQVSPEVREFYEGIDLQERIQTFPAIIREKAQRLEEIEKQIKNLKKAAEEADNEATTMETYKPKEKKWYKPWTLWGGKSGNTQEIIENHQRVTQKLADAQKQSAMVQELQLKFDQELATATEWIFCIGCFNMATNEAMIADLNRQLNGKGLDASEKVKLSQSVKEQFKNVVVRLQQQQDFLNRQERAENKLRSMCQSLDDLRKQLEEKDKLDKEQSALIDEIKAELNEKTKLDDEQSKDIKRLVVLLEAKDELDKNQTMQIDSLNKTISEYNDHVRRYKKYIVLISVISIASIILSVLQFFI